MGKYKIIIAKDFSITPGSRYPAEGPFSGQEFREKILLPKFNEALANSEKLVIVLDGTIGFATSFLEEAFGGLSREFGSKIVLNTLEFISVEEDYLIEDVTNYINEAND
jgi:STAS-like domain of unknown function (DUF4325)